MFRNIYKCSLGMAQLKRGLVIFRNCVLSRSEQIRKDGWRVGANAKVVLLTLI